MLVTSIVVGSCAQTYLVHTSSYQFVNWSSVGIGGYTVSKADMQ